MELFTAGNASGLAAGTTDAAASSSAKRQPAQKDPHFSHQDLRELFSLTRSLPEMVEQVSRTSVFGPAERMEQNLSLLAKGASRLSTVAENIRDRSIAGDTQRGVFWEHFDATDLLQVLMISTRALVGRKPVNVDMVSGARPLCMWSDSDKVLQIASNLLGNAARYTDQGRITLILGSQEDHLTLMVTDTGRGMREAEVKRITSRMNGRAGRRTSGRPALDTGLTRTSSLVELLGGSISLVSRWNEGTIVEVRLPLGPGCGELSPGGELPARSCA